jgi:hypothetical protein
MSQTSDRSANLSPSHPAFSLPSPTSPIAAAPSSSPFFRGRAKTLAALTTGSRNNSQTEMIPQELQLPRDPYVNGQRIEVFLYKDASECPICFLFYPPYLNKTRCCDQPICSECFVQIKRPDPHPPEHHDEHGNPVEPQEDGQFVSEPACCPFCKQPEFGITYEPPPFRRGLSYASQGHALASAASAMSSTSSLNSQRLASPGRRRAASVAATDVSVITTDRVRPDWAKKLADARSHALRRAAAATALHNAAYMMGNIQSEGRSFGLGRRRRTMFGGDSAGSSGQDTPRRDGDVNALLAAAGSSSRNDGQVDLTSGRQSSRRGNRLEDLEELMMMEAIRLSLAAEEDRKKKEDKEAAKEAKKEEKKKAKEAKKADKAARKSGFFNPSSHDGVEDEGVSSSSAGKGKAVDRSSGYTGFSSLTESTSTNASSTKDSSQKHLEHSRAQIQREVSNNGSSPPFEPLAEQSSHRAALRNISNSSSVSSFAESLEQHQGALGASSSSLEPSPNASGISLNEQDTPPQATPGTEPMFNFRSLAEVITKEERKSEEDAQHIENLAEGRVTSTNSNEHEVTWADHHEADSSQAAPEISILSPGAPTLPEIEPTSPLEASVTTLKPTTSSIQEANEIEPVPRVQVITDHSDHLDQKHIGNVSMVDTLGHHEATQ